VTLADVQAASAMQAAPTAHATYKTFDGLVADIDGWVHDDKHYIALKTGFDQAQADRFKAPATDEKKDSQAEAGTKAAGKSTDTAKTAEKGKTAGAGKADETTQAPAAPDVAGQVATLNAKLSGWVYEVPGYKYEAIFRPLDELLKHDAPKQNELIRK
jgi:hypothetical protein